MNNLAGVLYKLNRLKEAEDLYREALMFRKTNLSSNHPDIGISMINLALVLHDLNLLKEAEYLNREALEFSKVNC